MASPTEDGRSPKEGDVSEDLKPRDGGPEEHRKMLREDDTEGHRKYADDGEEPGPDGAARRPSAAGDEDDVEGHRK
jgi:hypothetical protein